MILSLPNIPENSDMSSRAVFRKNLSPISLLCISIRDDKEKLARRRLFFISIADFLNKRD